MSSITVLYELYSDTDVRKDLIVVGARNGAEDPAYIINKILTCDYGTKKIVRISDAYLIAAESLYRLGDEGAAAEYLAELLNERDAEAAVTETGEALFERIIEERRKELAFEGDRYHTINRLKRDVTGRESSRDYCSI